MKKETENQMFRYGSTYSTQVDAHVREIYEPRYGRRLSDDEVDEIRTNLKAFAEGIMEIAERLYGGTDNLPEIEP